MSKPKFWKQKQNQNKSRLSKQDSLFYSASDDDIILNNRSKRACTQCVDVNLHREKVNGDVDVFHTGKLYARKYLHFPNG